MSGIGGTTGRFLAFWSTLVQGAFSYLGTEIVALTAGEAQNPRRNMPKAIRRVFVRILFLFVFLTLFSPTFELRLTCFVRPPCSYVIGTFIMGLIVSPNDPLLTNGEGVAASPWVCLPFLSRFSFPS
jgi:amino acid transporter